MIMVLSLCIWFMSISTGPQEELFLQAGALYYAGNARAALDVYEQIANKGPAVWYNMGNCARELDDTLGALLYWRRAQKGAPRLLYQAIDKALIQNIYHTTPSAITLISNWCRSYAASLPLWWIQFMVLCAVYLLWTIWHSRYYTLFMLLSCLFLVGTSSLFLYSAYDLQLSRRAIIIAPTPLFSGPNTQYTMLASVDSMNEVIVLDEGEDWYKIKSIGTLVGWIPKACVALL